MKAFWHWFWTITTLVSIMSDGASVTLKGHSSAIIHSQTIRYSTISLALAKNAIGQKLLCLHWCWIRIKLWASYCELAIIEGLTKKTL